PSGARGCSRAQNAGSPSNAGRQLHTTRPRLSTSAPKLPLPITPSSRLASCTSMSICRYPVFAATQLPQVDLPLCRIGDEPRVHVPGPGQGVGRLAWLPVADQHAPAAGAVGRGEAVLVGQVVADEHRYPAAERGL